MSTGTRVQNVENAMRKFVFEFGNTLGMWRGRTALCADPDLIADKDVQQAAYMRHEFEVNVGEADTQEHITVEVRFAAYTPTKGSFILYGSDDLLAAIAAWAAQTQPEYDEVCNRDGELQFYIVLDSEENARKAQTRIPKPEPVICVFPGMPPANA